MLEYFIANEKNQTLIDVINAVGINRNTGYRNLKKLLKDGVISKTNQVKHLKFYSLNKEKEEVKLLIELYNKMKNGGIEKDGIQKNI